MTEPSIMDHYIQRPSDPTFENMQLLHFTHAERIGYSPIQQKMKINSVRPYCSPDPNDPKYEEYCQQKLMLYVP